MDGRGCRSECTLRRRLLITLLSSANCGDPGGGRGVARVGVRGGALTALVVLLLLPSQQLRTFAQRVHVDDILT